MEERQEVHEQQGKGVKGRRVAWYAGTRRFKLTQMGSAMLAVPPCGRP